MEEISMKTKFSIISIIIILSIIFMGTATPASALPGSNWATGIKLQNLTSVNAQNVSINLRDKNGVLQSTISSLSIPAGSSIEVYLPNYTNISNNQYSAEIASDVPIGAVATMTNYDYGIADSYNTMEPSLEVSVPYVYHNHNNWATEIFIQNTTNTTISGQISLIEGSGSSSDGIVNKNISFSIGSYGVYHLNTNDSAHNDLNWFIGSAQITASDKISVVSNQVRLMGSGDIPGNVLIQSRGLSANDLGTRIVIPSLYKNFSGTSGTWVSGIKLVNPSLESITVDVKFSADSGTFTGIKTVTIPAKNNSELYLPNVKLNDGKIIPDMFLGSALIEVRNSKSVVATVQHTNYSGAGGYGVALGYTGFSQGNSKISLPSLYRWPSGNGIWVSGIKVQNLGVNPVTITIDLKSDPDVTAWTGKKSGITLNPGAAFELYLGANGNLDSGKSVPIPWKGSAVVTAIGTDAEIVATVLHTNYGRHVANMYTGVGMEP